MPWVACLRITHAAVLMQSSDGCSPVDASFSLAHRPWLGVLLSACPDAGCVLHMPSVYHQPWLLSHLDRRYFRTCAVQDACQTHQQPDHH
jgi:hypothetical protein